MSGIRLVLIGTLLGCISLTCFLLWVSGSAVYAVQADPARQQADEPAGRQRQAAPAGCALSDSFPGAVLRWCDLITRHAQSNGLAPDLVAALIWLESGGDEQAVSHSGAIGLMQVMPRDGVAASFMCVNGPCFHDRPASQELYEAEFNIAYGTKMLAGLMARRGDLREALKAYGPKDVGYSYADKVLGIFQRYGEQ
jgi:soluble lytic murein transglycosylase-like protein